MKPTRATARSELRAALDAALIMMIGMGFGRFAFTAIYPHMVEEGLLSLREGSWAASANYAGYLLGAILAVRARASSAHRLCLVAVTGTALCLAVLAVLDSVWAIVAVRGLAGVFSALSMVAASLWLLEHRRYLRGAPLLYGGVGLGIALSAELLVFGSWTGLRSHGLWLLLGAVSLAIGLAAASGLINGGSAAPAPASNPAGAARATVRSWPLVGLYGLAGFGYIVTATYLPLLVKQALPGLDPTHVWAVFGLGAAPSCFLWHRIHLRVGTRVSLSANLMIQALSVILPVLLPTATGYLLSALLVGATFMGTVTIAMPAAQDIARKTRTNLMAVMTLVHGTGQIAGPIVASAFYARTNSFSASLFAAAAALAVGGLASLLAL
jgi:MFS family permease